ncbi:MAG: hypothetical protein AAGC55_20900, partial [Myxococcota bacterium]
MMMPQDARQSHTRLWFGVIAIFALIPACAGAPPPQRGVLEENIEDWNYRRYQKVLDVEVWVAKNEAVAHTASYVRNQAEKVGQLGDGDVVSAFVTRYKRDRGVLRALVKFTRRLAQDSGYLVEERSRGGVRFISVTGNNEAWAMWASPNHIIKVGGRGRDGVPRDVVKAYGKRYPSVIEEGLLDGPLPPGPDFGDDDETGDGEYDPDEPSPDWDGYDSDKVDVPAKDRGDKDKDK